VSRSELAPPRLCQVAICSADATTSMQFYAALLGLRATGSFQVRGPMAARLFEMTVVQGVNYWMADAQAFFQLEFFEFSQPCRLPAATRTRSGYERLFVAVADIDAAVARLQAAGIPVDLAGTVLRDPDGVPVQLVEAEAGGAVGRIIGVRLVVEDLEDAVDYFHRALGLPLSACQPSATVSCDTPRCALDAGEHWIELVHRQGVGAVRPLNEPGLMNVALGVRRPSHFNALYRRVLREGFSSSTPPVGGGLSHVVYLRSRAGLSVELLQLPAWMDAIWGFRAPGRLARLARLLIGGLVGLSARMARASP
jgi:catechol 2,3-dioxygenase-like lactoylglutathione lyase family enzyme